MIKIKNKNNCLLEAEVILCVCQSRQVVEKLYFTNYKAIKKFEIFLRKNPLVLGFNYYPTDTTTSILNSRCISFF